ncbi:MAG TPA: gamma-glutamyl-gamma-aminobutyrate hydrolase family protein [Acidimicrobiales bacterium]|nr:gamma-glutamyl-gamma-aminobutyrate hydrolase family protein [Acidimicrobiales bacterium]
MTTHRRRAAGTPLVGVTTYHSPAAWGALEREAAVLPASYFELVAAAGGRPLLLPPCRSAPGGPAAGAAEVVDALDALVLAGGGDLDPAAYGRAGHPAADGVDRDRDRSEEALLAAALDRGLPVLGICRGLQLLNVHLGGTLLPHLPDRVGHDGHRPAAGGFADVDVATVPGTRVAAAMGDEDTVRCSHHQALDRLGDGLVVAARSADGSVEAAELPGRPFVVGVQWHPEESADRRLFDALLGAVA